MKKLYLGIATLGILLLFLGVFIFNTDSMKLYSGLCYGIGIAMLGLGIGNYVINMTKTTEEIQNIKKNKDIIVNDERNILIKQKTGYMVSKIMFYLICFITIIIASLKFDIVVIYIFVALLVLQSILYIVLTNYYTKKL